MRNKLAYMRWPLLTVVALFVAACASMGRPQGGPVDEDPPVFVGGRPAPGAVNVKSDRIVIEFNENIQVDDPLNKVVVSPAQKNPARVSGVGRKVTVNLMDSLLPNTTYTIDFTDAIKDLNEGNVLDGFAFDFSTGPVIDSLCISGMVFEADNLEPAQSMLVGVHSNLSDTAITTLPFDRITRTNQYGQFTVRNLKPGTYNVFAINDVNRDNKWDRSEDIAFFPVTVSPSASRVERADTVKGADGVTDSIVMREVTAFAPNDLLLTWFNENYKSQYIVKSERKERNKIQFELGAPSDTLPSLRFVGGPYDGEDFSRHTVLQASATRDTLTYWITDTAVVALDSLYLATAYLRTDTLDNLTWTTDTLNFSIRKQKKKEQKKKKTNDTVPDEPQIELLKIKSSVSSQAEVYSPLILEFSEPLDDLDVRGVRMEMMAGKDTVWSVAAAPEFAAPGKYDPLRLRADYKWIPGAKYRLSVDSMAVRGVYGHHNGNSVFEFGVRATEDYGNISFDISGLDGEKAFVQLLNAQDEAVYTESVNGAAVKFRNVLPGTYYARLVMDRNGNRKWDTGSVSDRQQPEDVFYYPKKINLKKNWDINQTWNLFDTPVDLQKPLEIKKNKPKQKSGQSSMQEEEDDQYYDEFGNPAVDPDDPFGKRKKSNYNRTNKTTTGRNGLGNGMLR